MQTFLPYKNFDRTASVLDRQRLGKQRVENLQIMKALVVPGSGWGNHPATKMWSGSEEYLVLYHRAITKEWVDRGYKDSCWEKMADLIGPIVLGTRKPSWLGSSPFHLSHQSNLVRKDPDHYREFFPDVPDDLPYVWPINERTT